MAKLLISNAGTTVELDGPGFGAEDPAVAAEVQADRSDGHMDGWGDGGWWVMIGMMSVFWIGVLAIAAWGVATYAGRGTDARAETPLEIARRRYARGEITAEEFERMKRDLA